MVPMVRYCGFTGKTVLCIGGKLPYGTDLCSFLWEVIYGGVFIAAASSIKISQMSEPTPGTFDVLGIVP